MSRYHVILGPTLYTSCDTLEEAKDKAEEAAKKWLSLSAVANDPGYSVHIAIDLGDDYHWSWPV